MKVSNITEASEVKDNKELSHYLYTKWRNTGYTNVMEWIKTERLEISHETASSVMLRNRPCGFMAFLQLGTALELSNEDMATILKNVYDDKMVWRRLQKTNLGLKEQLLVAKFQSLNSEQQDLVLSMIDNIGGKA